MITAAFKKNVSPFASDILNAIERKAHSQNGVAAGRARIVAVFSCSRRDGGSTIVEELARGAQQLGRRVALIDLNIHDHYNFGKLQSKKLDLFEALTTEEGSSLVSPDEGLLWIAPLPDQAEKIPNIRGKYLMSLFERLREPFDYVFVDAPAILNSNLSELISLTVDQSYLVVRQQKTSQVHAEHAIERFTEIGRPPTGLIFNDRRLIIPNMIYRLFF